MNFIDIPDFYQYNAINESKKMKGVNIIKKCILFTDIKKSSELWKNNEYTMYNSIIKHEDQIFRLCDKYSGEVIKSIGDAYMVSFDSLFDAVKFSIDLQKECKEKPIKVGNKKIELRIGFCFDEIYEYKSERQNKQLLDYFGNGVNTASRMESKVTEVGEFSFSFNEKQNKEDKEEIIKLLEDKCKSFKVISYTHDSNVDNKRVRSGRLLSDTHKYISKSIKKLNGVDDVVVYNVKVY